MKAKCIIVDDEPLAMVVIESYLAKFPDIELVTKCDNALSAFEALQLNEIDLMFLDIQMPKITGIDFLKKLKVAPKVIITTAYREYAIESYELDVLDYLVKPISFDRFSKAVSKFWQEFQNPTANTGTTTQPTVVQPVVVQVQQPISTPPSKPQTNESASDDNRYIFVKENKRMIKISLDEVLYIESIKDYVKIYAVGKSVITKQQISYFEETLDKTKFLRIHRSFIVAIPKIEAFSASEIEIAKKQLPIGRSYKNLVFDRLNSRNAID